MAADSVLELPPAAPPHRPRTLLVGTGFGLVVVAMYFVALMGIYALLRSQTLAAGEEWFAPGTVQVAPGVMMWFTTLLSVVTMQWAVYALTRNIRSQAYLALLLTFVFGLAVINQCAFYFNDIGLPIDSGVPALMLFAVVGSFMALVLVAMITVALVSFRALAGQYTGRNPDGVIAAAMLWYLMVVVYSAIWILIFVTK